MLTGCVEVVRVPQSTERICQLTGEFDPDQHPPQLPGQPTINRTESRFLLRGTDLGAAFQGDEWSNVIYFLFGDSTPVAINAFRPLNGDSIAFADPTTHPDPENCIHLDFFTAKDHGYMSPSYDGVVPGTAEVPIGGFWAQGQTYVVFTTGPLSDDGAATASILARGSPILTNSLTFHKVYDFPNTHFISVSPVTVDSEWHGSRTPTAVLFFRVGEYKKTGDVFPAYVDVTGIEDKKRWRFFHGFPSSPGGAPVWSANPSDAISVFSKPGQSCRSTWNRFLRKWLMLYGCYAPIRGIQFLGTCMKLQNPPSRDRRESAVRPTGPRDHRRRRRIPAVSRATQTPRVRGFPTRKLAGSTARGDEQKRSTTIYFVMSTWNPYRVVLMKSSLQTRCAGWLCPATASSSKRQRGSGQSLLP